MFESVLESSNYVLIVEIVLILAIAVFIVWLVMTNGQTNKYIQVPEEKKPETERNLKKEVLAVGKKENLPVVEIAPKQQGCCAK